MINKRYVIGIDFGSDSARALLLDSANGTKLAEASSLYPRGGEKRNIVTKNLHNIVSILRTILMH